MRAAAASLLCLLWLAFPAVVSGEAHQGQTGTGSWPAAAQGQPQARAATRAHLQVVEVEYHLILSRGVIKAGPVDLQAIDRGMDPHDLRLQRAGSSLQTSAPELTSGQMWNGVVDLRPGIYKMWCALPEHARLGMRATLRVVR